MQQYVKNGGGDMTARAERNVIDSNSVRLMDIDALCVYLSLGRNKALEFGEMAGAKRKIGRRTLYDKKALDEAIDLLPEE